MYFHSFILRCGLKIVILQAKNPKFVVAKGCFILFFGRLELVEHNYIIKKSKLTLIQTLLDIKHMQFSPKFQFL